MDLFLKLNICSAGTFLLAGRCGSNNRDLKIGRRDELGRLPEVNLHNRACARELLPRVFAVVVSSRTPFIVRSLSAKYRPDRYGPDKSVKFGT